MFCDIYLRNIDKIVFKKKKKMLSPIIFFWYIEFLEGLQSKP